MELKSICLICPEYPPGPHGGVGTLMQVLARELVKMGFEVRVVGVYPESYTAPDYEEDYGVKVWRIRFGKGKYSWIPAWFKQYRMVKHWHDNKEIDIVEAPDSRGWFAFWPKLNIPLVLRANGSVTYFADVLGYVPNKLTALLEQKSYNRVDGCISASAYTAKVTKKVFNLKKNFEVIYNGIENVDVGPNEREKNKIVFSGTLIEKKGIVKLVQAFKLMHSKGVDFTADLCGKDTFNDKRGSMKEYLMSLMDETLKAKISFKGHVTKEELYNLYSTATLAIFPSYAEAFAMAPLESMICACPTIFTKLGSGPEVIEDGKDGLLINPDSPEEIENALMKIINDTEFAKTIGDDGRKKVKKFFLNEIYAKKTIDFYKRIIKEKQ